MPANRTTAVAGASSDGARPIKACAPTADDSECLRGPFTRPAGRAASLLGVRGGDDRASVLRFGAFLTVDLTLWPF